MEAAAAAAAAGHEAVAVEGQEEEEEDGDVMTMRFLVGVRDLDHLGRVLRAFERVDGMLSAHRSDLLGDDPVDPRPPEVREHHRMEHGAALEAGGGDMGLDPLEELDYSI